MSDYHPLTDHLEQARVALNRAYELARLAESDLTDEIRSLLAELYGALFVEAVYDPSNEASQKFALPLWKHIQRLNQLIGFRQ